MTDLANPPSVDGAGVQPVAAVPTPAVMRPRINPDDIPLPEEVKRAEAKAAAHREAELEAEREAERRRARAREARERRARDRVETPPRDVPEAVQMTAGTLAEYLGDVQASTPVWQVADSDDERDLIPVQFVEVLKVNGVVERLVIK